MGRPAGARNGGRLNPRVLRAALWLLVVCVGCSGNGPGEDLVAAMPDELDAADPLLVELVEQSVAAAAAAPDDAGRWRHLGQVYQANRLYDPAVEAFARAVALDASDARAWYGLGVSRAQLGRAAAALAAFDRVARLTDYPPVAWRRGYLLLDSGQLTRAREAFEAAVANNPADPAAQVGLARVDLLEGNAAAAVERLERLAAGGGKGLDYLHHLLGLAYRQAGRPDDAAAALARGRNSVAVWRDPWTDEIVALRRGFDWTLAEARRALGDGRFDVALPALVQLRQQRPTDRELLVTLGAAYSAAGRERDAEEAYRQLAREHDDDYRAHYELSRFHDRGRRLRQALQHAERSVELNEAYAAGWRQLGRVLRRQSRAGECERATLRAAELAPADPDVWTLLGDCRMDLERWDAAAVAYERAVAEAPTRGSAWAGLATAAARAGRPAEADAALEHLRRSGPTGAAAADALARELGLTTGARP